MSYGSSVSVNGNSIVINGTTITATATTATERYSYEFSGWTNTDGTITEARTITANFTRTQISDTCIVTIKSNNTEYGTVSISSLTIPYDCEVSVSNHSLTINGTSILANYTSTSSTSQFDYSFSRWSVSDGDIISGSTTITAYFTKTVRYYNIVVKSNNESFGTVSFDESVSVARTNYYFAEEAGNTFTIGNCYPTGTLIDDKMDIKAIPTAQTSTYLYYLDSWTKSANNTDGILTITANFARRSYNGTLNVSFTGIEGDYIEYNGNTYEPGSNFSIAYGETILITLTTNSRFYRALLANNWFAGNSYVTGEYHGGPAPVNHIDNRYVACGSTDETVTLELTITEDVDLSVLNFNPKSAMVSGIIDGYWSIEDLR